MLMTWKISSIFSTVTAVFSVYDFVYDFTPCRFGDRTFYNPDDSGHGYNAEMRNCGSAEITTGKMREQSCGIWCRRMGKLREWKMRKFFVYFLICWGYVYVSQTIFDVFMYMLVWWFLMWISWVYCYKCKISKMT